MGWSWRTKAKWNEEETKIKTIVEQLLSNPDTLIEIDPFDMSYIISHEDNGFYVDIDSIGIKIISPEYGKEKHLTTEQLDVLKGMAKVETHNRRVAKRGRIFKTGIELLDKMINKLT